MCAKCPQRAKEGIESLEAGLKDMHYHTYLTSWILEYSCYVAYSWICSDTKADLRFSGFLLRLELCAIMPSKTGAFYSIPQQMNSTAHKRLVVKLMGHWRSTDEQLATMDVVWFSVLSSAGCEPRQVSVLAVCPQELPKAWLAVPVPVWLHRLLLTLHPYHLPLARRQLWGRHPHQVSGRSNCFLEKIILPYLHVIQNWREYTSLLVACE